MVNGLKKRIRQVAAIGIRITPATVTAVSILTTTSLLHESSLVQYISKGPMPLLTLLAVGIGTEIFRNSLMKKEDKQQLESDK